MTKEWDSYFKKVENKEMEPLYLENLPFRFDTRGIIEPKDAKEQKIIFRGLGRGDF